MWQAEAARINAIPSFSWCVSFGLPSSQRLSCNEGMKHADKHDTWLDMGNS